MAKQNVKLILTAEEEQLILKKREEEKNQKREDEESQKPKKTGVLKHDLYDFSPVRIYERLFSDQERKAAIENFEDRFTLVAKAGAIFDCYIDNGVEGWYDREYGLEDLSEKWAKENLTNIKRCD